MPDEFNNINLELLPDKADSSAFAGIDLDKLPDRNDGVTADIGLIDALQTRASQPNFLKDAARKTPGPGGDFLEAAGTGLNLLGATGSALFSLFEQADGSDLTVNQAIAKGVTASDTKALRSVPGDFIEAVPADELPPLEVSDELDEYTGFSNAIKKGDVREAVKWIGLFPENIKKEAFELIRETQNRAFQSAGDISREQKAEAANFVKDLLLDPGNIGGGSILLKIAGKTGKKIVPRVVKAIAKKDVDEAIEIVNKNPDLSGDLERVFSANGIDVTDRVKAIEKALDERSRAKLPVEDQRKIQSPESGVELKEKLKNEESLSKPAPEPKIKEAKSLESFVRGNRIKSSDLEEVGFGKGSTENKEAFLRFGSKSGDSVDEVARKAREAGVINEPPGNKSLTEHFLDELRAGAKSADEVEDELLRVGTLDDLKEELNLPPVVNKKMDNIEKDFRTKDIIQLERDVDAVFSDIKIAGLDLPPAVKAKIKESLGIKAKNISERFKEAKTRTIETIQDSMVRVKNLQERPDVNVRDGANIYQAETLFHGRLGSRLEDVQDRISKIDKDLVNRSKKLKKAHDVDDEKLLKEVNEFLVARHAPERNAVHGDGAAGITNAQAAQRMNELKALPYFDDVKAVADQVADVNKQVLDILHDGHMIDDKTYNQLRKTYKNHVPLQRILEGDDDIIESIAGTARFKGGGSGLKRAKGSDLEVDDILTNVTSNLREAVTRVEKNRVNLNTLNFARENQHLGIFDIQRPKVIGKRSDGSPIFKQNNDPQTITVMENGKRFEVRVRDSRLAAAISGANLSNGPSAPASITAATRFMASVATRFNPEFFATNIIRDVEEMAAFVAAQGDLGAKAVFKQTMDVPKSVKDIIDDVFRGMDTEGAKLYRQMREDGGTTGGLGLSTRQELKVEIEKIRKLNRSKPREAAQRALQVIDDLNRVFEDATRLSVYRDALKRGLSRERAAFLAKEATINFNRKGTSGAFVNSVWMFSNASIQGSFKMARALKNPKVAAGVSMAVGIPTLTFNAWNDAVDPDWRDKIRPFDRVGALPIVFGSNEEGIDYITIPVGWGLKPIKTVFDMIYDAGTGKEIGSKAHVAGRIAASILDSYNPLGGSDFIQSVTPTVLDIPVDIARNKAWHGGSIRPEFPFLPGLPNSRKWFKSFEKKPHSGALIAVAQDVNDAATFIDLSPQDIDYAMQQLGGGPLKTLSKLADVGGEVYNFQVPSLNTAPISSRFFKTVDAEKIKNAEPFRKLQSPQFKDVSRQSAIEKAERSRLANEYLEKIKATPDRKRKQDLMKELINRDPRAAKNLKRYIKEDQKGLNYFERQLSGLEPGQKAEWLKFELQDAKPEEREAIIDNYIEKKLIKRKDLEEIKKQGIEIDVKESIKRIRKKRGKK